MIVSSRGAEYKLIDQSFIQQIQAELIGSPMQNLEARGKDRIP